MFIKEIKSLHLIVGTSAVEEWFDKIETYEIRLEQTKKMVYEDKKVSFDHNLNTIYPKKDI